MHSNFKIHRDGVIQSGCLRFWGTAELDEPGLVREAIFGKLAQRDQEHLGTDVGIGVLIRSKSRSRRARKTDNVSKNIAGIGETVSSKQRT